MLATADPIKLVDDVLGRVFRPPERLTCAQWAMAHRTIELGGQTGPWNHARTPQLRQLMDAASDPAVRRICLMKAEQLGGTEAIYNILMWRIARRPMAGLFVYPNQDLAIEVNKRRLLPTLLAHPMIARLMPSLRDDTANLRLSFGPSSFLHFAGSNSEANLESFARDFVAIDELDRCAGSTSSIVAGRTNTYPDSLSLKISTPSEAAIGIDAEFATSDRRLWWTPCPKCGQWHVKQNFASIGWDQPSELREVTDRSTGEVIQKERRLPFAADPAEVEAGAWWTCQHCSHRITASEHRRMSLRGIWCPTGWRPADDMVGAPGYDVIEDIEAGRLDPREAATDERLPTRLSDYDRCLVPHETWQSDIGEHALDQLDDAGFTPLAPHPSRPGPVTGSSAGFHLRGWDGTLLANPFGKIAREFVELKGYLAGEEGRQWVCRRVGEAYKQAASAIDSHTLQPLCISVEDGGYVLGQPPAGSMSMLAMGIDVQKDCLYVEVRAFGPRQQWTALVDAYRLDRDPALLLTEEAIRQLPWATYTSRDGRTLPVGFVGIDSGYEPEYVYDLVAWWRAQGRMVWATKGQGTPLMGEAVIEKKIGEATDIARFKGSLHPLLLMDVNRLKSMVMARIEYATRPGGGRGSDSDDNAALLAEAESDGDVAQTFRLPADCPREYMVQVCAEQRVAGGKRSRGMPFDTWEVRPGYRGRNHFLDTAVITHAIARRVRLQDHEDLPLTPVQQRSRRVTKASARRFGRGSLDRGRA